MISQLWDRWKRRKEVERDYTQEAIASWEAQGRVGVYHHPEARVSIGSDSDGRMSVAFGRGAGVEAIRRERLGILPAEVAIPPGSLPGTDGYVKPPTES